MSMKFKFPRIDTGLYQVVRGNETVGLIQKQVEGKEVSWWIYNTADVNEIGPSTSVENPEDLLREAKEVARKYFTENVISNLVSKKDPVVETSEMELKTPQIEEDFFDSMNAFEEFEDAFVNENVDLSDIDLNYSEEEELAIV